MEKPDVNLRMFNALLFVANLPKDKQLGVTGNGVKLGDSG